MHTPESLFSVSCALCSPAFRPPSPGSEDGVRVRWDAGKTNVYRYGARAALTNRPCFDVVLAPASNLAVEAVTKTRASAGEIRALRAAAAQREAMRLGLRAQRWRQRW